MTLPRELTLEQSKALIKNFVQKQFVDRGMIADIAIHRVKATDGLEQPHAHILLTTRDIGKRGFRQKRRDWNAFDLLKHGEPLGRRRAMKHWPPPVRKRASIIEKAGQTLPAERHHGQSAARERQL